MGYRVLTVVGARPQFIKAAMMSREFAFLPDVDESICHTGQHFDANMSQLFFDELKIPAPKVNLGISGGTHAQMTARMLVPLEELMLSEKPDMLLVYGDTNSTLAGALAAAKLHIPVCHAEAGPRTHFMTNPEEINRICTDHVSSVCCSPTPGSQENLEAEGLADRSTFTGDLMYDSFLFWRSRIVGRSSRLSLLGGGTVEIPDNYVYLTCHREENTDDATLREVMRAACSLGSPVLYPVHPRMQDRAAVALGEVGTGDVQLLEPVGYLESLALLDSCEYVITDSGGLQREAFFAGKRCVTLLPFPSCDELLVDGSNVLVPNVTCENVLAAVGAARPVDTAYRPFGDGRAAEKIARCMLDYLEGDE